MFENIIHEHMESVSYETRIQTVVPSPSDASWIELKTEFISESGKETFESTTG